MAKRKFKLPEDINDGIAKFKKEIFPDVPESKEDEVSSPQLIPIVVEGQHKEPSEYVPPVRMKVLVVRAYVFSKPNLTSRSVAAVSFGNILQLLEPEDCSEEFFKVRVPRGENSPEGFILKTKAKRI